MKVFRKILRLISKNQWPIEVDNKHGDEVDESLVMNGDWKLCAMIELQMHDSYEEYFQFENTVIRVFRPSEKWFQKGFIAEVYAKTDDYLDIFKAYYGLVDKLEQFSHRLALTTFKKCHIIKIMGVSPFKVNCNEPFELLIPDVLSPVIDKYRGIKLTDCIQPTSTLFEKEILDAIREIKFSLENDSILRKFHHYYNAIERIADFKTTELVSRKCSKCGNEKNIGIKATASKMRDFFLIEGFTEKDFNKCRRLRGKIAHGSGEQNQKLIEEIYLFLGKIEKVAANTVSKVSGINILSGKIPRIHAQFGIVAGVKTANKNIWKNASYNILDLSFSTTVSFNKVEDTLSESGEWRPLLRPMPKFINRKNFNIFPYSWPY